MIKIKELLIIAFLSLLLFLFLCVWNYNNELATLEKSANAFKTKLEGLKGQAFLFNQLAASLLSEQAKPEKVNEINKIHSQNFEAFLNSNGTILHNRLQDIFSRNYSWLDASDLLYFKLFDSNTVLSNKPIDIFHADKALVNHVFSDEYCKKFIICTKEISKDNLSDGFIFSNVHNSAITHRKTLAIISPIIVDSEIVAESHIDVNLERWQAQNGMDIRSKRDKENLEIMISNRSYQSPFSWKKVISLDNYTKVTFDYNFAGIILKLIGVFVLLLAFNVSFALYGREKDKHSKTKFDSMVDVLTGCYNRKILDSIELKNRFEEKNHNTVIVFDGNKIKAINDKYGHDIGDQAILTIAQVIKSSFRKEDIVVRTGGDEFIVIALGLNVALAHFIVDEINTKLSNRPINNSNIISVSAGLAPCNDYLKLKEAINIADTALYENKKHNVRGKELIRSSYS